MRTKPGIFRTQAFRIVLAYVLLFAFSVSALLFFTYWNTRRTLDGQTDQIIEAEITGLSVTEAAQALGISPRTADRVWAFARAWLHRELTDTAADPES